MNKKRLVTMLSAIALVALLAIGATLAFFTDQESATNSFAMGNVGITLTETSTDEENVIPNEDGSLSFTSVMPNQIISKIPVVTVDADSLDVYIRARVVVEAIEGSTITAENLAELESLLNTQILGNGIWERGDAADDTNFYVIGRRSAGDFVTLFNTVQIPSSWGNNTANQGFTIRIIAEAIQADNLTSDAWTSASFGN